MATITLTLQDLDMELEEISIMSWEVPAMLEANSIDPEDLHGEWQMMDRYIREDCETSFDFDRVAKWIVEGDLTDGELRDLSYRIACELVGRLESVRELGDAYLAQTRTANERVRELEAVRAIG